MVFLGAKGRSIVSITIAAIIPVTQAMALAQRGELRPLENGVSSAEADQEQLQIILERKPGGRERLTQQLAVSAQKARAAFEQVRRLNDEADTAQRQRSAARRAQMKKIGGSRAFFAGEVERLRRYIASVPPPQQQPALQVMSTLLSQVSGCRLGQPVLYDAPETMEPERYYDLSGCNLASGYPTAPKVALRLDSGMNIDLMSAIDVGSSGSNPNNEADDSISIWTPALSGVFDGNATLVLTTADGKVTQIGTFFQATRDQTVVQPPALQGECSGAADTNHCAGAGGKVLNSFVAYHHRVCCGWVAGNDHYFLPGPLAKGWSIYFRDVSLWGEGTGSSCGPAGGAGHVTAIEGGEKGASSVDIRVHWNTAWMCSEIMYVGVVYIQGPKGTPPF
jgi:hypothetical protein